MRIYHRIGPNIGIGFGLGGGLLFAFLVILGALPFVAVAIVIAVGVFLFAMALALLLALAGTIYKKVTGNDAGIPVPGSEHGTVLEYWMEEKGWIRLPQRLHQTSFPMSGMSRKGERGSPQRKSPSRRP